MFITLAKKITCTKNPDIIYLRFRGVTDSTNDFGSFSQGSNPCGTAKIYFLAHLFKNISSGIFLNMLCSTLITR